jgi:hypothetical protein
MIKLGELVRDESSGVEGIAVTRSTTWTGLIRFTIQPQSEDAKAMPDGFDIDHHVLTRIDDGISNKVIPADIMNPELLGAVVQDIHTGQVGTAMQQTEFLNGCVMYSVQPRVDKDGKALPTFWADQKALVMVTQAEEPVVASPDVSGGPSTRLKREKAVR